MAHDEYKEISRINGNGDTRESGDVATRGQDAAWRERKEAPQQTAGQVRLQAVCVLAYLNDSNEREFRP